MNTNIFPSIKFNEISKLNRVNGRAEAIRQVLFLAYGGRPAQSGRRLLEGERINGLSISLSSLTKRQYPRMKTTRSDTSSHVTFNEISKPNRANGRAEAIRQALFLAYGGRPAQSGRRLICDETIKEPSTSLTCLAYAQAVQKNPRPVKGKGMKAYIFLRYWPPTS